jgi:hypothetical protein
VLSREKELDTRERRHATRSRELGDLKKLLEGV